MIALTLALYAGLFLLGWGRTTLVDYSRLNCKGD